MVEIRNKKGELLGRISSVYENEIKKNIETTLDMLRTQLDINPSSTTGYAYELGPDEYLHLSNDDLNKSPDEIYKAYLEFILNQNKENNVYKRLN